MDTNKALISYISNHFSMHSARVTIMVEIILSLIKVGSVQQQKIAQGTDLKSKISSTTRRIQRFFEQQFLCPSIASEMIFNFFDWEAKIIFILDRTNWKFGKFDINFLTISAVYKNCSIPICWILLPHCGNSQTNSRINLIEMLLSIIPANRIKYLLADREFIGADWFKYLNMNRIPFCIRLKENYLILDTRRGGKIKLKKLFQNLSYGQYREIRQIISGVDLQIFGTRTCTGELLILAVSDDGNLLDAFELYRSRWTIETMFKALKSAGFNFENTHQQNMERLYKLMILLAISYTWAVRIGEIKNNIKPIRIKLHKKLEFSLFSYGFRTIQTILLKGKKLQAKLFYLIANIALNKAVTPNLGKVTVVY